MGIISTTKAIQAVRAGWLLLLEIRESNEVDMGKRILLISNYFAPDNTIAAVRTTKIAKYLIQNGYYVEVIKEKQDSLAIDESLREDSKNIKISYAINSKQYKRIKKFYDKLFGAIRIKRLNNLDNRIRINPRTGKREFYPYETAYPLLGSLDYIMEQMKQFDLFRSIKRELREKESFDYILTSYGDSFCFFAGKYYHKYHRNTKWIFDIRDAIYRYKFVPDYIKFIPQLYEKYVWKNSDCIIGVSKAICKRVPAKYRYKVHCVTNGYDWDDRKVTANVGRLETDKMNFVYTGSMYGGLMDLSVFFKGIGKLIEKGELKREKIRIHYAGNASAYEIFKSQAEKYLVADRCVTHGKLNREQALELQQGADILLVASYDYKNNEGGVITGKILEYMSAQKPVIAIIMGDIVKSELAMIIHNTQVGIAYEEANDKMDFDKLCEYIKKQYTHYTLGENLEYYPRKEELEKYDYKKIGIRLSNIIKNI